MPNAVHDNLSDEFRALLARHSGARSRIPEAAPAPLALPARAAGVLATWYRRWADRCELAWLAENYPDQLLDDIGVSRKDLLREARKPFWCP